MYGRNGECPCVVLAACSPSDCFDTAIEASKIAIEHMIPVMLLSDGYIANGSEPWNIPDISQIPEIKNNIVKNTGDYMPYVRNPKTLARQWAIPGMKGKEHRIGGLEKEEGSGNVNYDPDNHDFMVKQRQNKVDIIENFIPPIKVFGKDKGNLLVLSWGGVYGSVRSAVNKAQKENLPTSHIHLKHLNPFPKNLGELVVRFEKILIPELNMGQLLSIIRAKYLVDAKGFNKIAGKPFSSNEIYNKIVEFLKEK